MMEIFGTQQLQLEILKPFIKSKTETSAGLLLELEWDRSFEKLILSSRRLGFSFDSTRKFVASHTMVKQDEMDETWRSTFARLLGTGVVLGSRGTLFRKYAFEISPTVKKIRDIIPEVVEDDSLARSLNEDPVLMKLVSETKPTEFTADLSVSLESLSPGVGLRSLFTQPRGMTWAAEIEIYVTRGRGIDKVITTIMDMMDITIRRAVENSKRLRGTAA
jgi:hypothetical protein